MTEKMLWGRNRIDDGEMLVNARHLRKVWVVESDGAVMAAGTDGVTYRLATSMDYVIEAMGDVVPAAPGFFCMNAGEDTREPVVAWRVGFPSLCMPVTPQGSAFEALVYPDGRVLVDEVIFESVDAWRASEPKEESDEAPQPQP